MKIRLSFVDLDTIDCTADPHKTSFTEERELLDKVLEVCESDLVRKISRVVCEINGTEYKSDYYSDYKGKGNRKEAKGEQAKKKKVEGLYLVDDADVPAERHLPIGIEGVREMVKLIKRKLKEESPDVSFYIDVMWDFGGQISCSDEIKCDDIHLKRVDFCNQDWYTGKDGYEEHLRKLGDLVGASFEGIY